MPTLCIVSGRVTFTAVFWNTKINLGICWRRKISGDILVYLSFKLPIWKKFSQIITALWNYMKFLSCQLNLLQVKGTTKVILNSAAVAAVTTAWSFHQRCTEYNYWMKFALKGFWRRIRMYLWLARWRRVCKENSLQPKRNNGFFTVILTQEADELLWTHHSIPLCEPMSEGIIVISALSNSPIFPDYPRITDSIIWHSVAD